MREYLNFFINGRWVRRVTPARLNDTGVAIREEMRAPQWLACDSHANLGPRHFRAAPKILREHAFAESLELKSVLGYTPAPA